MKVFTVLKIMTIPMTLKVRGFLLQQVSGSQQESLVTITEVPFKEKFDMKVSYDLAYEHLRHSVPEAESTTLGTDHVDHGESTLSDYNYR